jgi:LPXTG-site transpeptidase (sortase) family protein
MSKEFIIFQSRASKQKGYVLVAQPKRWSLSKKWLPLMVILPLLVAFWFVSPMVIGEVRYRLVSKKQTGMIERSKFSYVLSPNDNEMELIIPKIAVRTQVLANVNPNKEEAYNEILNNKAAHAQGSAFPGQKGLIYLFGHSTNSIFNKNFFNPVFYSVKNLEPGDQIAILYQGKVHVYQINEKMVVNPDDFTAVKAGVNEEKLVLQTCWPPGTSWKRLLLVASPIT